LGNYAITSRKRSDGLASPSLMLPARLAVKKFTATYWDFVCMCPAEPLQSVNPYNSICCAPAPRTGVDSPACGRARVEIPSAVDRGTRPRKPLTGATYMQFSWSPLSLVNRRRRPWPRARRSQQQNLHFETLETRELPAGTWTPLATQAPAVANGIGT